MTWPHLAAVSAFPNVVEIQGVWDVYGLQGLREPKLRQAPGLRAMVVRDARVQLPQLQALHLEGPQLKTWPANSLRHVPLLTHLTLFGNLGSLPRGSSVMPPSCPT